MTKVLFILTASEEWALKDGSTHAGGVWSPEFVYPHQAFEEAGYDITVATLGGVPAPVDEASLGLTLQENDQSSVDFQREYLERDEIKSVLENPARLEDLDPSDYDIVFVPGGFGVFEDVADNPVVGKVMSAMYAQDRVVATICSGASALLGARNDDGSWPFVGKRITGFPTSEQVDLGVADGAPWLLQSRLSDAGADYVDGKKHKDHVEVDGNLVTGQNGASAKQTAAAVVATRESRVALTA
jgi:putative intracellular protease/amidase